ncbi:sodium/potassium/calcium exchanger 2-like [Dendronephthya gigantea]|uniref:sodium/potassium/calcium exchanger 2-like n=1 Tax=Dendronephthya gigantea TaxID=151771 RepID=UPI00106A667E|nr:sodium/potassium/calcium exchanger 2-like [Dendronephthya gigantea]
MRNHVSSARRNSIVVLSATGLFVILLAAAYARSGLLFSSESLSDKNVQEPAKNSRVRRSLTSNGTNSTNSDEDDTTARRDEYPDDVFSLEQKQRGAVILHVLGLSYMFLALATVSDEFFIPSLEVITAEYGVSEDVAGATFMAAGGSAPELFTSVIGVFVANSNVGFGTIVGSAVFNVLFVIGMCAVFSKGVLHLTWWPLFRDCIFYMIALILLITFFVNGRTDESASSEIYWWEAVTLMVWYIAYALFMKYNVQIEQFVKKLLPRGNRIADDDAFVLSSRTSSKDTDAYVQKALEYMKRNGKEGQCFRFGVLQLVMRTIDPLREVSVCDLAMEMETISHKNRTTATKTASQMTLLQADQLSVGNVTLPNSTFTTSTTSSKLSADNLRLHTASVLTTSTGITTENDDESYLQIAQPKGSFDEGSDSIAELPEPLDLSWPKNLKDKIVYVIRAPILFALYVTLSDVRKPNKRRRYPWTFFVSILWIVVFSYFMVWWAKEISVTMEIDDEIMGLTVLAAGTSIPDLITSVLVARKGYGDMAVSSSVGSNLFDVTIGLPLPWLIWSIMHSGDAFEVVSSGLFCSTIMLFAMLLTVIISIAVCKWQMSKTLGGLMLVLYFCFVVFSVLLQKDVFQCDF